MSTKYAHSVLMFFIVPQMQGHNPWDSTRGLNMNLGILRLISTIYPPGLQLCLHAAFLNLITAQSLSFPVQAHITNFG